MEKHDLLSSILIAKYILDRNPKLISSIELDRGYLGTEKLDMKNKVPLHTCIRPFIQVVKSFLRNHTGSDIVEVKIYKVDTKDLFSGTSRIAGIMAKKSETQYFILLNSGENYCTQRLSLCKELCQIYVSCLTSDPLAIIDAHNQILEATRELIEKFYIYPQAPKLTDKFSSDETFAHSIALELMIPYTVRNRIREDIDKKVPTEQIAKSLSITIEPLEEYLKNYFELTTPIYQLLAPTGDPGTK
jgi:hypothetical protein